MDFMKAAISMRQKFDIVICDPPKLAPKQVFLYILSYSTHPSFDFIVNTKAFSVVVFAYVLFANLRDVLIVFFVYLNIGGLASSINKVHCAQQPCAATGQARRPALNLLLLLCCDASESFDAVSGGIHFDLT